MSKATFTFGRFNPPTEEGHGKLVSAVQAHAEKTGGKHYIFPSHSQDAKKNPLSHGDKVGAMKRLFPNANIVSHGKVRTAIDAMKHLEKQGHTHVTMVVGSDRVGEFHSLLNKYRTKEFPGIKKVEVKSAGNRDPDAEGAEGMSASKLRGLVAAGKRDEFVSHYSDPKLGAHIHDKVKAGLQMESLNPVGIFLLGGPGSGKDYVLKNIFSRFDLTEVQADQLLNGAADELIREGKNIVINGVSDASKISEIQAILEGMNYVHDYVHVSVTNKVSRLRNEQREQPLVESKRIEKFLKAEELARLTEAFVFNNSINLNESSELEKVFFADQIEKLLERVTHLGLEMKEDSDQKTFVTFRKIRSLTEQMKGDLKVPHTVQSIADKHKVSVAVIMQALKVGKQVEMEHTKDDKTAETIALAHLWEKPDYYTLLAKMEQHAPPMIKVTDADHQAAERKDQIRRDRRDWRILHHQNRHIHKAMVGEAVRHVPKSGNITAVMQKRDLNNAERAAYEKSKIQLATSKVQEEVWDEPSPKKDSKSLTPAQKAKAKARAAKAGRKYPNLIDNMWAANESVETQDINDLFEMQLLGTDEYRKHAIAMTPGQSQEIANAFTTTVKTNKKKTNEESDTGCGCGGNCKCDGSNGDASNGNLRRFSELRKEAKEKDGKDDGVETQPTLTTKHKKGALKRPSHYDYTLQGLPVTARFNALEETDPEVSLEDAIQYHLKENVSFTENVFRPGSEMFFEMIKEAKRLYKEGKYTPKDEWEIDMLNSDIGEKVVFEGKEVILDYPFEEELNEADDPTGGKGIGKPFRSGGGGAVYVRTGDGGVRKINFSQSGMTKKYNDPAATRSFVARHHCLTNKDKTSRSYWACRWPRFFSNSGKTWW